MLRKKESFVGVRIKRKMRPVKKNVKLQLLTFGIVISFVNLDINFSDVLYAL